MNNSNVKRTAYRAVLFLREIAVNRLIGGFLTIFVVFLAVIK